MPTPSLITTLPEYASIESVPLCAGSSAMNYAWLATDLADVRQPAKLRGQNRPMPTADGTRATRRLKDEARRLIPMLFTGDCESDGTIAVHDPDENCSWPTSPLSGDDIALVLRVDSSRPQIRCAVAVL